MKKIFVMLFASIVMAMSFSVPAFAGGSDSPTPYVVDVAGITLPNGAVFRDSNHVNLRTSQGSKSVHMEAKCITRTDAECAGKRHDDAQYIGKSFIPWSAFGLTDPFCVEWVQIDGYNEHYGEGGQPPMCSTPDYPEPEPTTPTATVTVPGETVTLPGETVTEPGETITVPGDTVTIPGDTVTAPGETVTQPGQTVTAPGSVVTVPGDTETVYTTVPGGKPGVPGYVNSGMSGESNGLPILPTLIVGAILAVVAGTCVFFANRSKA